MYELAKSLVKLRAQVDAAYPSRDKESDGWIGDLRHQGLKSDHNPNARGIVCAIDIDADLSPTQSVKALVDVLFAHKDPRIKYLIFSSKITTPDMKGWKDYHGTNAHKHHAHISVKDDDNGSPWDLGFIVPPSVPSRLYKLGSRGPEIQVLQARLITGRFLGGTADGIFGEKTRKAVLAFQAEKGLREDGLAGEATLKEMGL